MIYVNDSQSRIHLHKTKSRPGGRLFLFLSFIFFIMTNKSNSYALITGATSGIGLETAKVFAELGMSLVLLARREQKLKEIQKEIQETYSVDVIIKKVDVTDVDAVGQCFKDLSGKSIEVLVNNAGLALGTESFDDASWADLSKMIEVNIKGFTKVAHAAMNHIKQSSGHIFNISSIAGIEAYEGGHVYCATKAFVKHMSKALRIDLGGTGVRVTDIAPGAVDTGFSEVRFKGDKQRAEDIYRGYMPLYAKDIAECIKVAYTMPKSVNIEYMLVMPTAQASAKRIFKDET